MSWKNKNTGMPEQIVTFIGMLLARRKWLHSYQD
jgi:hypothetical protein